MFVPRLRKVGLVLVATLGLSACYDDGYGYGGLSVGYNSAGYYGDPYYDGYYWSGYGSGYGYGYPSSYYGWYNGFYYPGTGFYIYDRRGSRHRWSDNHRRYWEGRRGDWRGERRDNWDGLRNRRGYDDQRRARRFYQGEPQARDTRQQRRVIIQDGRRDRREVIREQRENRREVLRDRREQRR